MLRLVPILFALLPLSAAAATEPSAPFRELPAIAQLFQNAGLDGTFVLLEADSGAAVGHDHERARQALVPASTFKIPHTLTGLASGAVGSVDEVLPYGGAPQPFPTWERDMSLRQAIELSAVPIYQTLARRIGADRMRAGLATLDYGNGRIGGAVDRFWLDGPLRISAIDQARFLVRLARGELPLPAAVQAATREIVALERRDGATLYGKTGWQNAPAAGVGWWVGWVDDGERIHAFALNLDVRTEQDAAQRVALGKVALALLGVWPAE